MARISKNKVSDKKDKDVKVKADESAEEEVVKAPAKKEYTPVPKGVGGQFVDIGGGVRVPASEIQE